MQTHRAEGIILNTFPFRDYDQIITLFSKEYGLMKMIAKKSLAAKRGLKCAPFFRGEFIYANTQGELHSLHDFSLTSQHLDLRRTLACLSAAGACSKALLDTQLLHKPSEALYTLFIAYLNQLPLSPDPALLHCSFLLKLLRHEGLFSSPDPTYNTLAFARSFAELSQLSLSPTLHTQIRSHFHAAFQNSP